MNTENRETSIKSAINRSVSFKNAFNKDLDKTKVYKILSLKSTGSYYKILLNIDIHTILIEIMETEIFHAVTNIKYDNSEGAINTVSENVKIALYENDLYISGVSKELDIAVDFFEEFDIEITELKSFPIGANVITLWKKEDQAIKNYFNDITTDELLIDGPLSVESIVTDTLTVDKIAIGDWNILVDSNGKLKFE